MEVESWLARAARDAPRRARAVNGLTYARAARARAGRAAAARGARRARGSALALPPGEDFAVALHAVPAGRRARGAGRPAPAADRARARRSTCCVDAPAAGAALPRRRAARRARPRRAGDPRPHLGHDRRAASRSELTYGNWLWSALGSARRARASTPRERWLCTLPLSHVGGLSILLRSAIYGDHGDRPRALRHRRACCARCATDGATVVSLVPTTLARLLDAGLRDPPRAALGAARRRARCPPALLARARGRRRPRRPDLRADRGVLAGRRRARRRRCSAPRVRARAPTARSRRRARRSPAAPARLLRTGDLGALDADGRLRDHRAQGRHDRHRRRERRARRGRGGAGGAPGGGRGRRPRRGPTPSGARPSSRPSSCAPARDVDAADLLAHCRARLARFKVPKDIDVRRSAAAHALGEAAPAGAGRAVGSAHGKTDLRHRAGRRGRGRPGGAGRRRHHARSRQGRRSLHDDHRGDPGRRSRRHDRDPSGQLRRAAVDPQGRPDAARDAGHRHRAGDVGERRVAHGPARRARRRLGERRARRHPDRGRRRRRAQRHRAQRGHRHHGLGCGHGADRPRAGGDERPVGHGARRPQRRCRRPAGDGGDVDPRRPAGASAPRWTW